MVRTRKRESIGCAMQNENIQAKKRMELDIGKTHNADAEGPLCEDSVILAAMSLDGRKGHILKRKKVREVRTEDVAPSLVGKRGEVGCMLNDDNDAGIGRKRKLGNPKESGRPSADKARWVQSEIHQPVLGQKTKWPASDASADCFPAIVHRVRCFDDGFPRKNRGEILTLLSVRSFKVPN